jgi:hypothetical protein
MGVPFALNLTVKLLHSFDGRFQALNLNSPAWS